MYSVQAAAGVVNTAVNDQLAAWMGTEKDHFFLGKVSSYQKNGLIVKNYERRNALLGIPGDLITWLVR